MQMDMTGASADGGHRGRIPLSSIIPQAGSGSEPGPKTSGPRSSGSRPGRGDTPGWSHSGSGSGGGSVGSWGVAHFFTFFRIGGAEAPPGVSFTLSGCSCSFDSPGTSPAGRFPTARWLMLLVPLATFLRLPLLSRITIDSSALVFALALRSDSSRKPPLITPGSSATVPANAEPWFYSASLRPDTISCRPRAGSLGVAGHQAREVRHPAVDQHGDRE